MKSFFRGCLTVIAAVSLILAGCEGNTGGSDDSNDPGEGIAQTVPSGLTVSSTGTSGELLISWDPVNGSFFYELRWGIDGNYGTPVEVKGTSYKVAGLIDGTDYNFQIQSVSGSFDSGWSSAATGRPSDTAASELPAIPENIKAEGKVNEDGNGGTVTISWDAAERAESYLLEWGTDPNDWSGAASENLAIRTHTIAIFDVGDYLFRVRSVKGDDMSGSAPIVSVKFVRMVRTLTAPNDDVKKMRTLVIGPDGWLYTVKTDDPHTAWKINPNSIDLNDPGSRAEYMRFSTHGAPYSVDGVRDELPYGEGNVWTAGYVTLGPDNNYMYGVRIWGKDVWRWDLRDTTGDAPGERLTNDILAETELNDNAVDGGIAVGPDGTMYVAATYHKAVIKIPPPAVDSTPSEAVIFSRGGQHATKGNIEFQSVDSMTWGHDNAVYISDGYNDGYIWRIDPATGETTPAFGKNWGWGDPFTFVRGMTYHDGYYYFVHEGRAIYKMKPEADADPVLIAGHREDNGRVDGLALDARFYQAKGITIGSNGMIYVVDRSDEQDSTIRMISPLEVAVN